MTILMLAGLVPAILGDTDCSQYGNSCTECAASGCRWFSSGSCQDIDPEESSGSFVDFADECPVVFDNSPAFFPDWMGQLMPIIGENTILDLCLPGTHDSFTHDLSSIMSDSAADEMPGEILHDISSSVPDGLLDFIRQQSVTNKLNVTTQLDNGIRFVDFRLMYEYSDAVPEWHVLHFMESKDTALTYLQQIRDWVDEHPQEVLVVWTSRHGNPCNVGEDQFPSTTVDEKQALWGEVVEMFDGVISNVVESPLNSTSINTLLDRNHRVFFYTADWAEFTGSSDLAVDACVIDNHLGPSANNVPGAQEWAAGEYAAAPAVRADDAANGRFYLQSLASGAPTEQYVASLLVWWQDRLGSDASVMDLSTSDLEVIMNFVNSWSVATGGVGGLPSSYLNDMKSVDDVVAACAAAFNIPDMIWCPPALDDVGLLMNFYMQSPLNSMTGENGLAGALPHAIYIDGVYDQGTLRVGTETLWGQDRGGDSSYATLDYGYVSNVLLFNLAHACEGSSSDACSEYYSSLVSDIKSVHDVDVQIWEEATYGRHDSWP